MTVMHPSDRTYRSQSLRLSDLAVVSDVIEDVTFENCTLEGPAVVFLDGGRLSGSTVDGPPEAFLWRLEPGRERVIGAIGLVNCTIVGCRLRRLGIAVAHDAYDGFARSLSSGD